MQWPLQEMHEKFRMRMITASKHRRSKRTIPRGQKRVDAMLATVDISHTQSPHASGGCSLAPWGLLVQHPSRSKGSNIAAFKIVGDWMPNPVFDLQLGLWKSLGAEWNKKTRYFEIDGDKLGEVLVRFQAHGGRRMDSVNFQKVG